MAEYIKTLTKEIYAVPLSLKENELSSIFMGGGTPSLISIKELEQLQKAVIATFKFSKNIEITIEINPEDLNKEMIVWLKNSMFNRISIGIQTFISPESIGRRHSSAQACKALELINEHSFSNFSMDLIFGLPGSTNTSVESDLEKALSFSPKHISYYGLGVEKGTPLHKMVANKEVIVPGELQWVEMFYHGKYFLESNGYSHYEISNYCQEGFESKHNLGYWTGGNYLGLGSGAASRWDLFRWYNSFGPSIYIQSCCQQKWESPVAPPWAVDVEILKKDDILREKIMTELRLLSGMKIHPLFSSQLFQKVIDTLVKDKLIWKKEGHIGLTKNGLVFSDKIISDLANAVNHMEL
jgi:oxygen-independent coproporphyrinogen III oxidase